MGNRNPGSIGRERGSKMVGRQADGRRQDELFPRLDVGIHQVKGADFATEVQHPIAKEYRIDPRSGDPIDLKVVGEVDNNDSHSGSLIGDALASEIGVRASLVFNLGGQRCEDVGAPVGNVGLAETPTGDNESSVGKERRREPPPSLQLGTRIDSPWLSVTSYFGMRGLNSFTGLSCARSEIPARALA